MYQNTVLLLLSFVSCANAQSDSGCNLPEGISAYPAISDTEFYRSNCHAPALNPGTTSYVAESTNAAHQPCHVLTGWMPWPYARVSRSAHRWEIGPVQADNTSKHIEQEIPLSQVFAVESTARLYQTFWVELCMFAVIRPTGHSLCRLANQATCPPSICPAKPCLQVVKQVLAYVKTDREYVTEMIEIPAKCLCRPS